ncbi:MAG: hypothetical protein ACLQBD_02175 [Syntrophobacteraceae bacterium]
MAKNLLYPIPPGFANILRAAALLIQLGSQLHGSTLISVSWQYFS